MSYCGNSDIQEMTTQHMNQKGLGMVVALPYQGPHTGTRVPIYTTSTSSWQDYSPGSILLSELFIALPMLSPRLDTQLLN